MEPVTFSLDGKNYKVAAVKAIIPGVNDGQPLTALEIADCIEAQTYLVEVESPLIEEIKNDPE